MKTKNFICLLVLIVVLSFAGCCLIMDPPHQEKNSSDFEAWLNGIHDNAALYIFLLNCKYVKDSDPAEWKTPSIDYQQTPNEFFHNMKGDKIMPFLSNEKDDLLLIFFAFIEQIKNSFIHKPRNGNSRFFRKLPDLIPQTKHKSKANTFTVFQSQCTHPLMYSHYSTYLQFIAQWL